MDRERPDQCYHAQRKGKGRTGSAGHYDSYDGTRGADHLRPKVGSQYRRAHGLHVPTKQGDLEMQRLSSRVTFFDKRIVPIWMFAVLLVFAAGAAADAHRGTLTPLAILPLALLAIVFFAILKFLVFDLVDEVWDAGDALIVRNKGQEDRIPLAAISNVRYSPCARPPRVTLSLRTPSAFGDKITFGAPARFIRFTRSPLIDDLIKRIDAVRQSAR